MRPKLVPPTLAFLIYFFNVSGEYRKHPENQPGKMRTQATPTVPQDVIDQEEVEVVVVEVVVVVVVAA